MMRSVRWRLLLIALLPLVVLLPLLLGVTMVRWINRYDDLLIAKVASDLRVAEQYFGRIEATQAAAVAAVAQSVGFAETLNSDDGNLSLFLEQQREDLGLVSRALHEQLQAGHLIAARQPSGDFVIPCDDCPLVLVSAGVGLTPMLSMLHASAKKQNRPVWYVHGTRNGRNHALREEVDRLVAANDHLRKKVYYSQPDDTDLPSRDYDGKGHVTAERLLALDAGPEARYMLCGPATFLSDVRNGLEAAGVPADHIHFETFGPTG